MKIPALIEENKYLFGTYSVMALNNAKIVLDYISKKLALTRALADDEQESLMFHEVITMLKNEAKTAKPEALQFATDALKKSFPFIEILAEAERKYNNKRLERRFQRPNINESDIYKALNKLLWILKTYRNYTTHYKEVNDNFNSGSDFLMYDEQPTAYNVEEVLTVALRKLKDRFSLETDDLRFLQDNRYIKTRVNGKLLTQNNMEFFLSLVAENGEHGKKHLSGVGVAFLICLFLEKKYVNLFLQKLPIYGVYRKDSVQAQLIRRAFGIISIQMPKERIDSEADTVTVALDMLNELKKCPKELYGTLMQADQMQFRLTSSDFNEVLMMRSSDRFAQLAMQYIDHNKLFENLRFQVNCGKVRELFNPEKLCIDGQIRVRVLEHQVNGFGRIQEVEAKRKRIEMQGGSSKAYFMDTNIPIREFDDVKRDDATSENYPYITDSRTQYVLGNNKINLLNLSNYETRDGMLMSNPENREQTYNQLPDFSMSVLELPAMMFHLYKCGAKATEKILINAAKNYEDLFTALSEGRLTKENIGTFGIDKNDIPQKVLDAVFGTGEAANYVAFLKKTLQEMLADGELRLKRIIEDIKTVNGRDNKMGKRGYRRVQPGKLAEFLAEDIVRFQPTLCEGENRGSDKLTGLNYRVMQATIAEYNCELHGHTIDVLKDLFKKAHLIQGAHSHPFLYKVLNASPKDTIEFYKAYLAKRKAYITTLLEDIEAGGQVEVPFVNKNQRKWQDRNAEYYEQLGAEYLDNLRIDLPRKLFDKEIKKALGKENSTDNITYLIGEYLKSNGDGFQPFYDFRRNYRYLDLLACRFNNLKSLAQNFFTLEERESMWKKRIELAEKTRELLKKKMNEDRNTRMLTIAEIEKIIEKRLASSRNDYQKTEKVVRRYKVQDAVLFLLAKKSLFDKNVEVQDMQGDKFKLRDIMPQGETSILSEPITLELKLKFKNKQYKVKAYNVKIKNYGDLIALKYDKRLASLLPLLSGAEFEKNEIEKELDNYDDSRPKVVKMIMEFEAGAYDKFPEIESLVYDQEHFDFSRLIEQLRNKGVVTDDDCRVLRQIRNAFSHNQYPEENVVKERQIPEIAKSLIDLFKTKSKQLSAK